MAGVRCWERVVVLGGTSALLAIYGVSIASGRWGAEQVLFALPAPLLLGSTTAYVHRQTPWAVEGGHRRLVSWFLLGIFLLGVAGWLTVLYQSTRGVVLRDPAYLVTNWATGGGFLGLLIGHYDGQRQRRERRLVAERHRVEGLNRRLAVLNRVLRHDLRNALTVILGQAERLPTGEADQVTVGATIEAAGHDLRRLSEKVRRMELALEAGAAEPAPVTDVVDPLVQELRAANPAATITASFEDPGTVRQPVMAEIALECILENALEHTDRADPEVAVTVSGPEPVVVRVDDDGPGIPSEERSVIERGWETPLEHSSGIGLWLATWILTELGGSIDIEDNQPRGTVVRLTFPGG